MLQLQARFTCVRSISYHLLQLHDNASLFVRKRKHVLLHGTRKLCNDNVQSMDPPAYCNLPYMLPLPQEHAPPTPRVNPLRQAAKAAPEPI